MKFAAFILLLLAFLNSPGQKPISCTCKGFIDTSYRGTIYLMDSPKGKITQSIPYEHIARNYLLFDITQVADSFFFVRMNYAISGGTYQGWIKKAKHLITFVKRDGLELPLFYEASLTSKIRIKTSTKKVSQFEIFNCTQNWLYIRELKKVSLFHGWIHSKDQCANPTAVCK